MLVFYLFKGISFIIFYRICILAVAITFFMGFEMLSMFILLVLMLVAFFSDYLADKLLRKAGKLWKQ